MSTTKTSISSTAAAEGTKKQSTKGKRKDDASPATGNEPAAPAADAAIDAVIAGAQVEKKRRASKKETPAQTGDIPAAANVASSAPDAGGDGAAPPAKKRKPSAKKAAEEKPPAADTATDAGEIDSATTDAGGSDVDMAEGGAASASRAAKARITKEEMLASILSVRAAFKLETAAKGMSAQTRSSIKRLRSTFTAFEKTANRFARQKPAKRVRRAVDGVERNNGLRIPRAISDELCRFMNLDAGSLVSREEVTTYISKYVVQNKLQHPTARINIVPDEPLQRLFSLQPNDMFTFTGVQQLLKTCGHFLPIVPAAAAPPAAAE